MQINRNNYEAYFVDYLEGNLEEHLVDDFIEFIKMNPDLKEELEMFESVSAIPEPVSFQKKHSLYKEKYDSEQEFNTAAIAQMEGHLSKEENQSFETYLDTHPERKKDIGLFKKTVLQANTAIVYPNKSKLYKKGIKRKLILWTSSVAAILILAMALFNLLNSPREPIVAENTIITNESKSVEKDEPVVKEIQTPPIEKKKKEPVKRKKIEPKPDVKKALPKKENNKSIRETGKGRIEHDDLAVRVPHVIPSEMQAITASLEVRAPKATFATITLEYPPYYDEEWLLADRVKEKISLKRISRAGLDLFASVSNERFTYNTNQQGEVTEYTYDSRLLGFSIPGKKAQPE